MVPIYFICQQSRSHRYWERRALRKHRIAESDRDGFYRNRKGETFGFTLPVPTIVDSLSWLQWGFFIHTTWIKTKRLKSRQQGRISATTIRIQLWSCKRIWKYRVSGNSTMIRCSIASGKTISNSDKLLIFILLTWLPCWFSGLCTTPAMRFGVRSPGQSKRNWLIHNKIYVQKTEAEKVGVIWNQVKVLCDLLFDLLGLLFL